MTTSMLLVVTRCSIVSNPSSLIVSFLPTSSLASSIGVLPRIFPSTSTTAPAGNDTTCVVAAGAAAGVVGVAVAVAGVGVGGGGGATVARSGAVRSMRCFTGSGGGGSVGDDDTFATIAITM